MSSIPGDFPTWSWSDAVPTDQNSSPDAATSFNTSEPVSASKTSSPDEQASPVSPHQPQASHTHCEPRQCRICLEVIHPTLSTPSTSIPSALQPQPSVSYISADPELGRLLKPCKCKGSSQYVHEGCLQSWRLADPTNRRNYFECPTCGYAYQLERLRYSRYIGSTTSQLCLTFLVLLLLMFVLGFIADPIINLYSDPFSILSKPSEITGVKRQLLVGRTAIRGWYEHFFKGMASIGVLGFLKVLWALGPTGWFNMRNSGLIGGRGRATTGRERATNLSWIVIVVGVVTTMVAIYKGVRVWSRRILERAGERVLDVQEDDTDKKDI